MKEFYRQKGAEIRTLHSAKRQVGYWKVSFLYGMAGVHQADHLTSADQAIPDQLL